MVERVIEMYICLSISSCECCVGFFFQAEDGIRDLVRSRGLGDVYKRQRSRWCSADTGWRRCVELPDRPSRWMRNRRTIRSLSLIHI